MSEELTLASLLEIGIEFERSIRGQTFEQFAAELFEFEYCSECGGDAEDHEPWIVVGNWFAHCTHDMLSDGSWFIPGCPVEQASW